MASSENQGLQIATIIFLILTIILGVTTFMFFKEWKEIDKRYKEAVQTALDANNNLAGVAEEQITLMKYIAGEDPSLADRTKNHKVLMDEWGQHFQNDMAAFAQTFPPEKHNYRLALAEWSDLLGKKQVERDLADEARKVAEAAKAKAEQEKTDAIAAKDVEVKKAKDDLVAAKDQFNTALAGYKTNQDDLAKQKDAKAAEIEQEKDAHKKDVDKLTVQLTNVIRTKDKVTGQLVELTKENFEVADGEIRWVNQQTRTVWINLGRADDLRRQVSFSVYSGDPQVKADLHVKGKIEVTQLLGDHLAEAKIMEDNLSDPLQPGDQIYTPLWHPGRAEKFAIVGFVDMDGDGNSDLDVLRDVIAQGGGELVSYMDATGKKQGLLAFDIRYIIVGAPPKDAGIDVYTNMLKEAGNMGIRQISLAEFLDRSGWKDTQQLARYGRKGNVPLLKPQAPDGGVPTSRGSVNDLFKTRRPPSAKAGSAY